MKLTTIQKNELLKGSQTHQISTSVYIVSDLLKDNATENEIHQLAFMMNNDELICKTVEIILTHNHEILKFYELKNLKY